MRDGLIEIGDGMGKIALVHIGLAAPSIGERDIGAERIELEKLRAAVDLLLEVRALIAVVDRVGLRRVRLSASRMCADQEKFKLSLQASKLSTSAIPASK